MRITIKALEKLFSKPSNDKVIADARESVGAKGAMNNRKDNPVEWALLLYQLDDAREHLESLINDMADDEEFCEIDYDIYLGHIFEHLNRAWNGRAQSAEQMDKFYEENSKLPTDIPTFNK